MNSWALAAGVLTGMTTLGHFTLGSRWYLRPMIAAEFDEVARKTMECVFHYVSVFLLLSTAALLAAGAGLLDGEPGFLLRFIALAYAGFGIWQVALAVTSGLSRPLVRLFQWTGFFAIAVCAWLAGAGDDAADPDAAAYDAGSARREPAPSFLRMISAGQNPVNPLWSRFPPTKTVSQSQRSFA